MRKFSFSPPAMIISFMLARGAEEKLQQALMMSPNGYWIFLERPVAVIFLIMGTMLFAWRIFSFLRKRRAAV